MVRIGVRTAGGRWAAAGADGAGSGRNPFAPGGGSGEKDDA